MLKNQQFVWNFVWNLPTFLANGLDHFNGLLRSLSGIFAQIDNFKSLEQNSEKWGVQDLFESLIFAVFPNPQSNQQIL